VYPDASMAEMGRGDFSRFGGSRDGIGGRAIVWILRICWIGLCSFIWCWVGPVFVSC